MPRALCFQEHSPYRYHIYVLDVEDSSVWVNLWSSRDLTLGLVVFSQAFTDRITRPSTGKVHTDDYPHGYKGCAIVCFRELWSCFNHVLS